MVRKEIYILEYPNLNLEVFYEIEYWWCKECEEYHTSETLSILINDIEKIEHRINLDIYIFFEEVKRRRMRELYRFLRIYLPKQKANSILGAIGNFLYLIFKRSYIPKKRAKKIVL